jgi:uncharacterized repeat protein (TIGR01451 family)
MRLKTLLLIPLFTLLVAGILLVGVNAAPSDEYQAPENIEPDLLRAFAMEGAADFVVEFREQADLSPAAGMDWSERGHYVYQALQEVAQRSQAQSRLLLRGRGVSFTTFLAGNQLYVQAGDQQDAETLAGMTEVVRIRAPRVYQIGPVSPASPDAPGWNLADVNAPNFWSTYGSRGEGIKVANIDTGVYPNHPALGSSYACGNDYEDPNCWEDPADICGGKMCDNNGHGTHTMGTMVGDDGEGNQIGMAPGSTWIACKGCEGRTCSEFALNACADWILAPGGDPDNRPHVVNNSWGDEANCSEWYLSKINAWRAAGIFPAFSAGNYGSDCGTLGSPGDLQEAFASAAHDSNRNVYNQGSRGPSCFGHEPYTKPNISAPGVGVRSSWLGGLYLPLDGTSMASPHSAGAVALLWSCNPDLVGQIDETFELLQDSTDLPPDGSCGAPPDGEGNYTFGYGYLNVYKAGSLGCAGVGLGTVEGRIYDAGSSHPIQGVQVSVDPGYGVKNADASGYYSATLPVGIYNLTASKYGYRRETVTGLEILTGVVTTQDFYLNYTGEWLPGPSASPFDYARFDGVFNPQDDLIYFLGGRTGGSTHDRTIWAYEVLNDDWTDTGCELLYNASNITLALIEADGTGRGEAIYVVGGYDIVTKENLTALQRYYPSSPGCLVEEVATDPFPGKVKGRVINAGGVAVVDDKLYYFGGWQNEISPYFSEVTWMFDPLAPDGNRWQVVTGAVLDPPRSYLNVAVLDDLVYAMGGISGYSPLPSLVPTNVVEVFDPADPNAGWIPLAPMPVSTAEGQGFAIPAEVVSPGSSFGDKLVVAGGGDWPNETVEVMAYDVLSGTWDQEFTDLITRRRDHAGVFVSRCTEDPDDGLPGMWVFGGISGTDEPPYAAPEYFPLPCEEKPDPFSIRKSVDLESLYLSPGDLITYTLAYTNNMDISGLGVIITDSLPEQVVYLTDTLQGGYQTSSHQIIWTLDVMTKTSSSLQLVVQVETGVAPLTKIENQMALVWSDFYLEDRMAVFIKPLAGRTTYFPLMFGNPLSRR